MNNLVALLPAFVRVAELASFTQAATSLGLPKANVSAAVQRLEAELGTRLLHRTTRRVELTHDGRTFYERAKDLLVDVDELQAMFRPARGLRGRLRVDMPIGTANRVIVPRLPEFTGAHPGIEIELSSSDRRVDLVREGFDCVLRVGTLTDSSLVARPLGEVAQVSVASRGYLAAHGTPRRLADLERHHLVHYVPTLGGASPGFEHVDAAGRTQVVRMQGALTVNNSEAYMAACRAGFGIIQVPRPGMAELLARGELVEVLPKHPPPPMPVSLVYPARRNLPKRVQAFMDWVAEVVRADLA